MNFLLIEDRNDGEKLLLNMDKVRSIRESASSGCDIFMDTDPDYWFSATDTVAEIHERIKFLQLSHQ